MDKRWYPAAISAVLAGCGGTTFDNSGTGGGIWQPNGGSAGVDAGAPGATGGRPATFYGILVTGGNNSIDGGAPGTGGARATGGGGVVYYGPMPVGGALSTGGRASGGGPIALYGPMPVGGAAATGGRAGIDGGGPSATGGLPTTKYGPMPVGGAGGAATGGKAPIGTMYGPLAATGGIDTGTPTGGTQALGGGYSVDYGVILP